MFKSCLLYIVACQRGGVSNKPTLGSGQRQDTPNLSILAMTTYKNFKKETAFFTKTG